MTYILNAEL